MLPFHLHTGPFLWPYLLNSNLLPMRKPPNMLAGEAMKAEILALEENQTWTVVDLLDKVLPIGNK